MSDFLTKRNYAKPSSKLPTFGMLMPNRAIDAEKYRFGFNDKENDNEVKGIGNQQDYGKRIYDVRLDRFLSVDPISNSYPELTPYQFASNIPLACVDLDGLEMYFAADGSFLGQSIHGGTEIRVATSYKELPVVDKNNIHRKQFIINRSQSLLETNLKVVSAIYKTIYNREIKKAANVYAYRENSSTTGKSNKNQPIGINLNVEEGGEYLNCFYYNVTNTLFHEQKHVDGESGSNPFIHFKIWQMEQSDLSYSKTTGKMKQYEKEVGSGYLELMEYSIYQIANDVSIKDDKLKTFNMKYYYEQYQTNVKTYNEKTGSDYKSKSLNELSGKEKKK